MNGLPADLRAALVRAMAELIQELEEIPAGHLYAAVSGKMNIGTFDWVIGQLVAEGLIERHMHVLRWVGEPAVRH